MTVPNWYELALLSLAAFRTWRFLAVDDLTDRGRRYVTRLGSKWRKDGDPLPKDYRVGLMGFIDCAWCLGAWISAGWWAAWQLWGHGTLVAAAAVSVTALVPLLARLGD